MLWQSPPHINQQVQHDSTDKCGVIYNIIDHEDNTLNYNASYVIVDWDDGEITCESLTNLSPVDTSEPSTPTPDSPTVLYNWDWTIPFLESQRVTLNPNCSEIERYRYQSQNTIGTIISIDTIIDAIDSWEPSPSILTAYIDVKWDCGHINSYPVNSLLPVTPVITTDSLNVDFKIGQKLILSEIHRANQYLCHEINGNFNAYIVKINPRTLEVIFEAYMTKIYKFNKLVFDIVDDTPIQKVTKYHLDGAGTYYTIGDITNDYLEHLVISNGYPVIAVEPLN